MSGRTEFGSVGQFLQVELDPATEAAQKQLEGAATEYRSAAQDGLKSVEASTGRVLRRLRKELQAALEREVLTVNLRWFSSEGDPEGDEFRIYGRLSGITLLDITRTRAGYRRSPRGTRSRYRYSGTLDGHDLSSQDARIFGEKYVPLIEERLRIARTKPQAANPGS